MPGGFRTSEAFNETKINLSWHWLRILAALGLALVLVGANQLPPAQAALDNPAEVGFELKAYPEAPRPLCPNQKLKIHVSVFRSIHKTISGKDWNLPGGIISGVVIRGSVTGANIGTLIPSEISGSYELADLRVGDADFAFTAKKAGKTTLKFDGEVGSYWDGAGAPQTVSEPHAVHVEVPVTVKPCKFKVKTVQQSVVAGGGNFNIVAMIDEAEMTADEQGHFTGTAPVNWVGAASTVGVCFASISVAPTTQANLTGDIDESGQLTGNLTFQAPETTTTATCYGISNTEPTPLSADPLRFSVPSSGGVVTVSQGFVFMTVLSPGSAVIVVTPEEDQAAAFNPRDLATRVDYPSTRGVMLWNDFPRFFSDLLGSRP